VHNKIKLLHLITGLGCGGAEKMVYQLCKYADRDRFELSVISIDNTDYFLPKLESLQIQVNMFRLKKTPFSIFKGILKLNELLRKNEIQVIHAHLFHGMLLACLVKIMNFKIKIIWSSHSSQICTLLRSGITYLLKPLRAHDIILQKQFNEWYILNKHVVIPNGIEEPKLIKKPSKFPNFTFISVGSLEKHKNHLLLINLFADLNGVDANLIIVGTGSNFSSLQTKIFELKLSNKIKLLGHRDDVFHLLCKSHCLLFPSIREGFGLVLVESAFAKIPIIALRNGSVENLISEEEGYVVGNDIFKKTMLHVINNYDEALVKMNNFYKKTIREFTIQTCITSHESLYKGIKN